jgi:hypothetical protein
MRSHGTRQERIKKNRKTKEWSILSILNSKGVKRSKENGNLEWRCTYIAAKECKMENKNKKVRLPLIEPATSGQEYELIISVANITI